MHTKYSCIRETTCIEFTPFFLSALSQSEFARRSRKGRGKGRCFKFLVGGVFYINIPVSRVDTATGNVVSDVFEQKMKERWKLPE